MCIPTQGFSAFVEGRSDGQTFYVGGSGPGNYTTIQEAADAADNGDTVFVYEKVYYENVVVNKEINLIGERREATIIDGSHASTHALVIEADEMTLQGFTIRNNGGYNGEVALYVSCNMSSILNCTVQTTDNDAIRVQDASNNTFSNCSIQGSHTWGSGDAIKTWYAFDNSFHHCEITNAYRYGILLYGTGNTFDECNFTDNGEAGIRMEGDNHVFSDCLFHDNGIGIEIDASRNHLITNCRFYHNNIGIRLWQYYPFNVTIQDCDVYDNPSTGIEIIEETEQTTIQRCRIFDNGYGIAIGDRCINTSILDCSIYNNSYGVSIRDYCNYNTLLNCTVYNNEVYGLLFDVSSFNTIDHCLVANNGNGTYFGTYCSNNTFISCMVLNNRNYGLYMNGITPSNDWNTITFCRFQGNLNWDIRIEGYCFRNLIHHNTFSNQLRDVYDTCADYWDDGHEGNYYARYRGKDQNGDGIGDTPYHVGAYNFDRYPLMASIPHDPYVQITSPLKGFLYVRNQKIFPLFFTTVIVGPINITVDASSNSSGIKQIDFYMDRVLIGTDTTTPYSLQWDEPKLFRHTLIVIAINNAGNSSMDERVIWTL
jgi:parallel beta-helix repeat protein